MSKAASMIALALTAFLALVGCESSSGPAGAAGQGGAGGRPGTGGTAGGGNVGGAGTGGSGGVALRDDLDCVLEGYPCSIAESDPEAHARSIGLLQSTWQIHRDSGMDGVRDFLEGQPDIVRVRGDDRALEFRIEGATPMVVSDVSVLFGRRVAPATRPSTPLPTGLSAESSSSGVSRKSIVGRDTNSDGVIDDDDQKRALVLAPFLWQFGEDDEAPSIAAQLENLRGYQGNVTFIGNANMEDQNLGLDVLQRFRDYDVIYFSTHGSRGCDSDGCSVVVDTGIQVDFQQQDVSLRGAVVNFDVNTPETPSVGTLALKADFFRNFYPSGLDDTLVVFSACETGNAGSGELARALAGDDFVMFGWTEVVDADDAAPAMSLLFEALGEGLAAEAALDKVFDAGLDATFNSNGDFTELVRFAPNGGDVRLFEIPQLLDDEGQPLEDGEDLTDAVEGAVGDGQNDKLKLLLQIDGVDDDNNDVSGYEITYRLDGRDLQGVYDLSEATLAPGLQYTYRVEHEVDVGFDIEPSTDASLEVIVALPEGLESRYDVDVSFSPIKVAVYYQHLVDVVFPLTGSCGNPDLDETIEEQTVEDSPDLDQPLPPGDIWRDRRNEFNRSIGGRSLRGFPQSCVQLLDIEASASLDALLEVPQDGNLLNVDIEANATSSCEPAGSTVWCGGASAGTSFFARFESPVEQKAAFRLRAELDCEGLETSFLPIDFEELIINVARLLPDGSPTVNSTTSPLGVIRANCDDGSPEVRIDQLILFDAAAAGTTDTAIIIVNGAVGASRSEEETELRLELKGSMRGFIELAPETVPEDM